MLDDDVKQVYEKAKRLLSKAVIWSTITAFSFASMPFIQSHFSRKHSGNAYAQSSEVYDGRNTSLEDKTQDLERSLPAGKVVGDQPLFGPKTDYATRRGPSSIFSADLDGDGYNDLAVANENSSDVSVLLNNGDGTFAPKVDYGAGRRPLSIFSADLDEDGDNDLAVANTGSNNVSVLLNNGDGTFAPKVDYHVGSWPESVFIADLDGDGANDLAVANYYSHNVSILLNNGDGTFAPKVDYAIGNSPESFFIADLDGDGANDLAVTNPYSHNVSILLNNGDGTFAPKVDYDVGSWPNSVFVADLDGDGDNDLAVANSNSGDVSVLLNNGDGTFAPKVDYGAGSTPRSVFSADLDGDGANDLAVANWVSDNISVLLNNGDGTFAPKVDYDVGDCPKSVFIADLNGDGDNDLAVANSYDDNVSVLLNQSNVIPQSEHSLEATIDEAYQLTVSRNPQNNSLLFDLNVSNPDAAPNTSHIKDAMLIIDSPQPVDPQGVRMYYRNPESAGWQLIQTEGSDHAILTAGYEVYKVLVPPTAIIENLAQTVGFFLDILNSGRPDIVRPRYIQSGESSTLLYISEDMVDLGTLFDQKEIRSVRFELPPYDSEMPDFFMKYTVGQVINLGGRKVIYGFENVEGQSPITTKEARNVIIYSTEDRSVEVEYHKVSPEDPSRIEAFSGNIEMDVPENFFGFDTGLFIERVTERIEERVDNLIGEIYDIGQELIVFNPESIPTLTMHYDDSELLGVDEETLKIFTYNEEKGLWIPLPEPYDRNTTENWVSTPIRHLSLFSLGFEQESSSEDNTPPVPQLIVYHKRGTNEVIFDPSESYDIEDRRNLSGTLVFGDGSDTTFTQLPSQIRHAYGGPGRYGAVFTVRDSEGLEDFIEEEVIIPDRATAVEDDQQQLPIDYTLSQNYPNPFNPSTIIQYSILKPSQVKLTIYNIQGQEVTTIVQGHQPPGMYSVEWDGKGFSSGIYFYRLQAGDFIQTRKMLLLK